MKVGIFTFHRAHNYGAFLQAFALKTYIESLGHEVISIDYEDKNHHSLYRLFGSINEKGKKKNLYTIVKSFVKQIILFVPRYKRYTKFQKEIADKLGVKGKPLFSPEQIKDECDIYIYGSDQIWRKDTYVGGFDKVFWGDYPKTKAKKISYAASMGKIVSEEEDKIFIKGHLSNFFKISVREAHLKDFLEQQGAKNINLVCDPTLLLEKETWINAFDLKKEKDSQLLFFYHLLKSDKADKFTKEIALKKEYKVVELSGEVTPFFFKKNNKQSAGPKEFLQYIYNADLVISTSFHGVVFALIFEKEFYAMGMDSNSTRVISLLEKVGLTDRYISNNDSLPIVKDKIDYDKVKKKINDYRLISEEFLLNSVI